MPVAQWKRRNASSHHVEKSCPVLIDSCLFALFQWQKKIGVGASYSKISACPAVAAYSAEAGCEGLDRAKADVIHTIRGRIFFRKLVSISVHSWLDPAFPRRAFWKAGAPRKGSQTRSSVRIPAFQNLFFTWT